ncbi:hypothetical protein ACIRS1_22190 [Kitasatospora sp. NPDC101176]
MTTRRTLAAAALAATTLATLALGAGVPGRRPGRCVRRRDRR